MTIMTLKQATVFTILLESFIDAKIADAKPSDDDYNKDYEAGKVLETREALIAGLSNYKAPKGPTGPREAKDS